MCTGTVPPSAGEALDMLESLAAVLAGVDPAQLPDGLVAEGLRVLERTDAVLAAARGRLLAAFDARDLHLADGQRTTRSWLVHSLRVTRGQAAEHMAVQTLACDDGPLLAGLRERAVSTSVALQLARWTRPIPAEFRAQAEEILVAAARAGAGLRELAAICAEIRYRTASPDPDGQDDPHLDRGLCLDTTLDGAGLVRGDLTPECAAMVQAVLDALSAPEGGGDLRTRPQRYHDALAEAMKRLLASGLVPQRAGQPVKALVHISFPDLCQMDQDSALQDKWIAEYRAQWAAHRAAASVTTGDGGAWLEGDAARAIACDAMIIPVVTGNIDPSALEELVVACARYHRIRAEQAAGQDGAAGPDGGIEQAGPAAAPAGTTAEVLAMLEHQILANVIQVVSGPGGVASFLRRHLLGKGLNGPSLPLDVGQP